jgi:hypothetical protein
MIVRLVLGPGIRRSTVSRATANFGRAGLALVAGIRPRAEAFSTAIVPRRIWPEQGVRGLAAAGFSTTIVRRRTWLALGVPRPAVVAFRAAGIRRPI